MSEISPPVTSDSPVESSPVRTARSSRRWRYSLAAVVLVVLGTGAWIANWRWPARELAVEFNREADPTAGVPRRFKVATFNIHGGFGMDGRLDLNRTAACLKGIDIVGLNEVHAIEIGNAPKSQADQLGEILTLNSIFLPTEAGWWGPRYGHGALSRFPIDAYSTHQFERVNGNGYRNYAEFLFSIAPEFRTDEDHPQLAVLITHLDRKSDRQDQLRIIIQRFLELPPPVILMGDLNAKWTEPQLQKLATQPGVIDCFGEFAKEPLKKKRIDWIFVRGLKCVDANLEANDASDHPWAWAELELP